MKDALKNLEYFIGKAVTIITTPINRDFDERQKCDYFVGVVASVDAMGVMTQHPITGCRNYYFYSQICSISEEQVLYPDKPEDAEMIAELEAKRQVVTPAAAETPFFDVDSLSKLTNQRKS